MAGMSWVLMLPALGQVAPAIRPGQLDINSGSSARDARQAQTPAPRISEREAVELAREKFSGNVLRISLIGQGDVLRYQIRMESEGKIFTVFVNANTGVVSSD